MLNIDLGRVQVAFNSADLKSTEVEVCDLNLSFEPLNKEKIAEMLSDKQHLIFGVGYHTNGNLGYATFNVMTNLEPGDGYFVYYYDEKQGQLILIAENMTVDEFGRLSFRSDCFGEYVISRERILGVASHEAVERQDDKKSSNWWENLDLNNYRELSITAGAALAILILGILFGYLPERAKFRRYIKRRSKENEKDGEALL